MKNCNDVRQHINAVDMNGKRYTTHCFSFSAQDWWAGAAILTPNVISRLKSEGLLPLVEVVIPEEV